MAVNEGFRCSPLPAVCPAGTSPAAPSAPRWGTCAGRWWARVSAATANRWRSSQSLEPALRRAREAEGPAVVCGRTDRAANLAIPPELLLRFVEVYQGPLF